MADELSTDPIDTTSVANEGEGSGAPAESQNPDTDDTLLSEQGQDGTPSDGGDGTPDGDGSGDSADSGTDTGEGKDGEGETGDDQAININYEELKVAEGFEVNFDDYKEIFEKHNFTQDQIQAVLDMGVEKAKKDFDADQVLYDKVQDDLQKAAREDQEFGGAEFDANLSVAKKALDTFGTPELMEYLRISGAGNHPEVIRAFVRVGKAISEDGLVSPEGGYGTGQPRSREEIMYPGMTGENKE